MTKIDQDNPADLSDLLSDKNLTIVAEDAFILIYSEDSILLANTYRMLKQREDNFIVFEKSEIPSYLNFGSNKRSGDVILIAQAPKVFGLKDQKRSPGAHGFDFYQNNDMGATFMAWGPAFKSGITISPFENVNVYPLAANILNLEYDSTQIDGKIQVLKEVLKPK